MLSMSSGRVKHQIQCTILMMHELSNVVDHESQEKRSVTRAMLVGPFVEQQVLGADEATFYLNRFFTQLDSLYKRAYFTNVQIMAQSEQSIILTPSRSPDDDPLRSVYASRTSKVRQFPEGFNVVGHYDLPAGCSLAAEFFPQDLMTVGSGGVCLFTDGSMSASIRTKYQEISSDDGVVEHQVSRLGEGGRLSVGNAIVFHNFADVTAEEIELLQTQYQDKAILYLPDRLELVNILVAEVGTQIEVEQLKNRQTRIDSITATSMQSELEEVTFYVLSEWLRILPESIQWSIRSDISEELAFTVGTYLANDRSRTIHQREITQLIQDGVIFFPQELRDEAESTATKKIATWSREKVEKEDREAARKQINLIKAKYMDPHRASSVHHIDQIIGSDCVVKDTEASILVPISRRYQALLDVVGYELPSVLANGQQIRYLSVREAIMDSVDLLNYPSTPSGKKYMGPLMAQIIMKYLRGGGEGLKTFQDELEAMLETEEGSSKDSDWTRISLNERISSPDKERLKQMAICITNNATLQSLYDQWQTESQQVMAMAGLDIEVLPFEIPVHELQKGGLKCKTNFL